MDPDGIHKRVYIADLSRSMNWATPGRLVPPIEEGTVLVSWEEGDGAVPMPKLWTGGEYMQAMGESVAWPHQMDYPCLWRNSLEDAGTRPFDYEMKAMAASTANTIAFGFWQLYCLSRLTLLV